MFPSDDVLKAADDRAAARESAIRRPAEEVFTISDEAYDQMKRRQVQRNEWDLVNLMEVRRRDLFTFVMLLEYIEEKFKSSTDDKELFERVAVVLCKSIPRDYLLYSFIDSTSPEKDLSTFSYFYNMEKIDSFGKGELSYYFDTRDIYNVLKAMSQKVSYLFICTNWVPRHLLNYSLSEIAVCFAC